MGGKVEILEGEPGVKNRCCLKKTKMWSYSPIQMLDGREKQKNNKGGGGGREELAYRLNEKHGQQMRWWQTGNWENNTKCVEKPQTLNDKQA